MSGAESFPSIARALGARGYVVIDGFLSPEELSDLAARLAVRESTGELRPAATGAGANRAVRPSIRGDEIHWLSEPDDPIEGPLLRRLDGLRRALNEELSLGLSDIECHYAVYPIGARYARHLDRSPAGAERVVSLVLYLNEHWRDADGGELRLYADPVVDLCPRGGTLVLFQSERFEHEVRSTRAVRRSLTGWFRRRHGAGD